MSPLQLNGIGNTFQWPAYSAAISTMIPKEQLGRANGMMSLMEAGPGVIAPLLAGALLPLIGLTGILAIDVVTFFFAMGTLAVVHIPQPEQTEEGRQAQGNLLKEAAYGFRYIFARPSLLGLQLIFFFGNLFAGICIHRLRPDDSGPHQPEQPDLWHGPDRRGNRDGTVGGVVMSAWGGFKRRIHGVLGGWTYAGLDRHGHPGPEVWPADLDRRDGAGRPLHAVDQQLQPGHLAVQGRAGSAGAGLFGPPADRLVHQPDLPHHRRHPGRFRAGAGHADDRTAAIHVWLAGGHRSRRGHGPAADLLRYSHVAGGGGGLTHPQDPQCRNDPAGLCPGG